MSVQVFKEPKDIKCPKCGNTNEFLGFDVDYPKDIQWVPNGHYARIGVSMMKCYDPVPKRVTCKNCRLYFEVAFSDKEVVKFD